MSHFYNDSVFWVEVDKIQPNPYQPRKEFDQDELQSLADSIRQYGVLQALVVTRREEEKPDGGLQTKYELISGERRLRASKLAGVREVPVLIRTGEESNTMKLELAIIENIQREDLNVVDRARAFQQLIDEFKFTHAQVAKKVGRSREYISNSLRVLALPEEILGALSAGKISEGHTRPLGMLSDRPAEQSTLFKEIIHKKISVREAERIARRIAYDKVRKKDKAYDPVLVELEDKLSESFGTRVQIERKEKGGRISIDFFSDQDLETIMAIARGSGEKHDPNEMLYRHIAEERERQTSEEVVSQEVTQQSRGGEVVQQQEEQEEEPVARREELETTEVDEAQEEPKDAEKEDEASSGSTSQDEADDLYSIRNFSI